MASNTKIQIKRSTTTNKPGSLDIAELAYSYSSNTLFIGGTGGGAGVLNVGGVFYTNTLDSASSANGANTLVKRDQYGNATFNGLTATQFTGRLIGAADTADKLTTARQIAVGGDILGSASFDGSQNINITSTLVNSGVSAGTYGGTNQIPYFTVDAKGRLTLAGNNAIAFPSSTWTVAGDTGSDSQSTGGTQTFIGGDGITTSVTDGVSATGSNVTIDVDSTVVRTTGNQTIGGNKTFTGTTVISGDLQVTGTTFYANSTTLQIGDNTIVLNNDVLTGNPTENAGIDISRGSQNTVSFFWDETADAWSYTNNVGTTKYVVASLAELDATGTGANTYARSLAGTANSGIGAAHDKANAAYAQANTAYDRANSGARLSFVTIVNDVSGQDVVADSNNDTLTVTGANGISVLGTASSDTLSVALNKTAVTTGTWGGSDTQMPYFTVDAWGRLTAAGNTTITSSATALSVAQAAFGKANTANITADLGYSVANQAFDKANTATTTAVNAFDRANGAYGQANAVSNYANSTFVKLTQPNQTITGNLAITGSLTVSGNAYTIDTETLRVSDPLIYLAGNNYTSDLVDIGFIGNYVNATGSNVHTGLYREHTDGQYYLISGYDVEPSNNHLGAVGTNNSFLAQLNANLSASQLVTGTVPTGRISGSYTGITGVGTVTAGTWNANKIEVGYGGTGQTSFTTNSILLGNGSNPIANISSTTEGHVLKISNAGVPEFGMLDGGSF